MERQLQAADVAAEVGEASATAIAIGIAAGSVGFAISKLGKRSIVAVITAYGHSICLNLAERAVALRSKKDREGATEARREPMIRLREFQGTAPVISWPRRRSS